MVPLVRYSPWRQRIEPSRQRLPCRASSEPITGYTPANYISFTTDDEHICSLAVLIEVEAPRSTCFSLWNDWNSLLGFLDLVAEIGLDPEQPDMGLFQCYYRWGRMPLLEIVFLLHKTEIELDKRILFETRWGMPAAGEVAFLEMDSSFTAVALHFEFQMPEVLVDMKVGKLGVQTTLRQILHENMLAFKAIAEQKALEQQQAAQAAGAAVGGSTKVRTAEGSAPPSTPLSEAAAGGAGGKPAHPATSRTREQPVAGKGQRGRAGSGPAAASASPDPATNSSSSSSSRVPAADPAPEAQPSTPPSAAVAPEALPKKRSRRASVLDPTLDPTQSQTPPASAPAPDSLPPGPPAAAAADAGNGVASVGGGQHGGSETANGAPAAESKPEVEVPPPPSLTGAKKASRQRRQSKQPSPTALQQAPAAASQARQTAASPSA